MNIENCNFTVKHAELNDHSLQAIISISKAIEENAKAITANANAIKFTAKAMRGKNINIESMIRIDSDFIKTNPSVS